MNIQTKQEIRAERLKHFHHNEAKFAPHFLAIGTFLFGAMIVNGFYQVLLVGSSLAVLGNTLLSFSMPSVLIMMGIAGFKERAKSDD
jgi:hypothetical protein